MKPFIGSKVALISGDSLIAIQRDDTPGIRWPDAWDLPGGAQEGAETPRDCAIREIYEELGLKISPETFVWEREWPAMHDPTLSAWFLVARLDADAVTRIKFGNEGRQWQLMPIAEFLRRDDAIPQLKTRLQAYLAVKEQADQIAAAEVKLQKLDPILGHLIAAQAPLNRLREGTYFGNLVRSIVSQQVSVAAARSILARVESATGLVPERVMAATTDELRALGLSRGKAGYIHDLAEHFVEDAAVFDHLEKLPDEQVITELTRVKGIGVWTAQMFLMFTLGRLDVFAPDDVGLQRAVVKLYGLEAVPPRAELERLAERWQPYRTVASWHLWHSLDNAPA